MKPKPASASAAPTPKPPAKAPKRPVGRPLTGSRPMTGAERQAALRRRQREAEMTAYGHPQGQPTSAVVAALGRLLAQLDDPDKTAMPDAVRDMAERALGELCARYRLKPKKSR